MRIKLAIVALATLLALPGYALLQAQEKAAEKKSTDKTSEAEAAAADPELLGIDYPAIVKKVTETRVGNGKGGAVESDDNHHVFYRENPTLQIEAELTLPEHRTTEPESYDKFVLEKAADNMGTKLNVVLREDHGYWSRSRWGEEDKVVRTTTVVIATTLPARDATSLEVHGTVDLKFLINKKSKRVQANELKVGENALKTDNLTVIYKGVETSRWGQQEMVFEATGQAELLIDIDLMIKKENGSMSTSISKDDEGATANYARFSRSVDSDWKKENMTFTFNYAEKIEFETAAFRLKDVKLP